MTLNRLGEHEPFLISQLVRNAIISIAVNYCWPLLQADNLTDAELARPQTIFQRVDPIGPMVLGLQSERAIGRDTLEMIRSAQINVNDLVDMAKAFEGEGDAPQVLKKLPYGEEMIGAFASILCIRFGASRSRMETKNVCSKKCRS
jgi:hypothetical protein